MDHREPDRRVEKTREEPLGEQNDRDVNFYKKQAMSDEERRGKSPSALIAMKTSELFITTLHQIQSITIITTSLFEGRSQKASLRLP
jgi:hypothetical protein